MERRESVSMREIHEIRERMQQEDKKLTIPKRIKRTNDIGMKVLEEIGLSANLRKKINV